MAVWVHLKEPYKWQDVAKIAKEFKLDIGEYGRYDTAKTNHNCIRMGFASCNENEIVELISRLKFTMQYLEKVF